ncbi:hypothetical protein V9T40_003989 [Parthenolecanium corni]|uniref:TsaA-like domain-containing protein n=1 Tax=Parthenolecanium corni TaxID=536013 RepID=A0AAN9Y2R6_9HEMI
MESGLMSDKLIKLAENVATTRKELQNIRKELRRLNQVHQKDMDNIISSLKTWKCESCSTSDAASIEESSASMDESIPFKPIGIITSSFHEKRGTPRQPGICASIQGKITLFNSIFTNPEHALEGLEDFSHIWILFYFHRNDSTHIRAKVSPPRLNGLKTGVFSTRSPHRPCSVGLSLVHLDYIDGSSVYFSGVDMLDGTPVLDIKPYIPHYDNPVTLNQQWNTEKHLGNDIYGSNSELIDHSRIPREAPDGEEEGSPNDLSSAASSMQISEQVRVPRWISEPPAGQLSVVFKERARSELEALRRNQEQGNIRDVDDRVDLECSIVQILQEDPRSVYVRERYANQFYTFLIGKYHVSCKFDDSKRLVQVYKIALANSLGDTNVTGQVIGT